MSTVGDDGGGTKKPRRMIRTAKKKAATKPTFTTVVGKNDVLLGRGTRNNRHDGNVLFRQLVVQNLDEYKKAAGNNSRKTDIAFSIIATIHHYLNGKFLRKVEDEEMGNINHAQAAQALANLSSSGSAGSDGHNGAQNLFEVVTDHSLLILKTKQAFRHFTRFPAVKEDREMKRPQQQEEKRKGKRKAASVSSATPTTNSKKVKLSVGGCGKPHNAPKNPPSSTASTSCPMVAIKKKNGDNHDDNTKGTPIEMVIGCTEQALQGQATNTCLPGQSLHGVPTQRDTSHAVAVATAGAPPPASIPGGNSDDCTSVLLRLAEAIIARSQQH